MTDNTRTLVLQRVLDTLGVKVDFVLTLDGVPQTVRLHLLGMLNQLFPVVRWESGNNPWYHAGSVVVMKLFTLRVSRTRAYTEMSYSTSEDGLPLAIAKTKDGLVVTTGQVLDALEEAMDYYEEHPEEVEQEARKAEGV